MRNREKSILTGNNPMYNQRLTNQELPSVLYFLLQITTQPFRLSTKYLPYPQKLHPSHRNPLLLPIFMLNFEDIQIYLPKLYVSTVHHLLLPSQLLQRVDDRIGGFRDKYHADGFLNFIINFNNTPSNIHQKMETGSSVHRYLHPS